MWAGQTALWWSRGRPYVSTVTASNAVESSARQATRDHGPIAVLTAAADPVRWTILQRLAAGQACVCELQTEAAIAPNLLSYHLKVLREVELVTSTRRGRWIDYRLADDALERLTAALPVQDETSGS